jgi:hypothetical protein
MHLPSGTLGQNLPMLKQLQEQSRWFSQYASNVTSQCGEDGIIAKALSLLSQRTFWCVEFGAWDGKRFSNTYDLITSRNYRGVLIEADPVRFTDLERTHGVSGRNVLLNAFVGFSSSNSLDVLLARCEIPKGFDLLSIDIDGNDYYVWEAVQEYRPQLVIIEYNPTLSNSTLFVQKTGRRQGASPASLVELARRKGYELVAATELNLLFVTSDQYAAFGIADNSLALMRDDSNIPHIFVGYDGHVFLSQSNILGAIALPWHVLKLKENDVQLIPEHLQKYPDEYTRADRFLFGWKFGFKRRVLRRLSRLWRRDERLTSLDRER